MSITKNQYVKYININQLININYTPLYTDPTEKHRNTSRFFAVEPGSRTVRISPAGTDFRKIREGNFHHNKERNNKERNFYYDKNHTAASNRISPAGTDFREIREGRFHHNKERNFYYDKNHTTTSINTDLISQEQPRAPKKTPNLIWFSCFLLILLSLSSNATKPGHLRLVGSAICFPYLSTIVEQMARTTRLPTPIIENTGTGKGVQLFCGGEADMVGASRPMTQTEKDRCRSFSHQEFGFDGIVLAQSRAADHRTVQKTHLHKALANKTATLWSHIMPGSAPVPIKIYGPSAASGTHEALIDLLIKPYGLRHMRSDGVYVESGQNHNIIVKKLILNPLAVGFIGYETYRQNAHSLQAISINGIQPSTQTIRDHTYPLSRSLFLYQSTKPTPSADLFNRLFTQDLHKGPWSLMSLKGLITK
jgi:phosphate transport system substrate-binding protein